jgi:hypothetical protein
MHNSQWHSGADTTPTLVRFLLKNRYVIGALSILVLLTLVGFESGNVVNANPIGLHPAYDDISWLCPLENQNYSSSVLNLHFREQANGWNPINGAWFYVLDSEPNILQEGSTLNRFKSVIESNTTTYSHIYQPYQHYVIDSQATTLPLADGKHNLTLYHGYYDTTTVFRKGNGWAPWHVINFTIDTTPPTISILSPKANQCFDKSEVGLEFLVNEPSVSYFYQIDDMLMFAAGNETISGLSEGNHSLKVFATDQVGYRGVSETVPFTVAFPEPTLTSTEPPQTQNNNTPTVHATLTATTQTNTPFTSLFTQPVKPDDPSSPFTALILGCIFAVTIAVCMTLLYLRKKQKYKA